MIGRLSAKAIMLAICLGMAFFGVGLLGLALAAALVKLFGLAGALGIAGGVLLLPPLFWAVGRLLFKPRKPPPPPTSGIVTALLAAVAKETPWIAIVGAGIAGAADMFLNRNKPKK